MISKNIYITRSKKIRYYRRPICNIILPINIDAVKNYHFQTLKNDVFTDDILNRYFPRISKNK